MSTNSNKAQYDLLSGAIRGALYWSGTDFPHPHVIAIEAMDRALKASRGGEAITAGFILRNTLRLVVAKITSPSLFGWESRLADMEHVRRRAAKAASRDGKRLSEVLPEKMVWAGYGPSWRLESWR